MPLPHIVALLSEGPILELHCLIIRQKPGLGSADSFDQPKLKAQGLVRVTPHCCSVCQLALPFGPLSMEVAEPIPQVRFQPGVYRISQGFLPLTALG